MTMNKKIITLLTLTAAMTGLGSVVQAKTPKPNSGNYTLSGNSLIGINNRTASNDFGRFFASSNSLNVSSKNATADIPAEANAIPLSNQFELRRNIDQPLTSPNSLIFPQGDRAFDANNGVRVLYQDQ
jgi:hypothetical protein